MKSPFSLRPQDASTEYGRGHGSGVVEGSCSSFLLPCPQYGAQCVPLTQLAKCSVQNLGKEPDSVAPITYIGYSIILGLGFYCHYCNFLPPPHPPHTFLTFPFLHPYYVIFKILQISIIFLSSPITMNIRTGMLNLVNLDCDNIIIMYQKLSNRCKLFEVAILLQGTYPMK